MDHKDKPAIIIIIMADQATTNRVMVPQEGSAATAPQGILADLRDNIDPQDATQKEELPLVIWNQE